MHYYCFETVSVSNCGWPDTCHVDQSSFELPEIHLTLLLKIKGSTSAFLSQALTLSQLALILAAVLLPSTHMGAHGSLKPVTPPLGTQCSLLSSEVPDIKLVYTYMQTYHMQFDTAGDQT